MDLNLQSKTALVTGASTGLGEATAKLLAAEGVKVAVHGRNQDRTRQVAQSIIDTGGSAVPIIADLTNPDDVNRLMDEAAAALGHIDILVANAGGRTRHDSTTWAETTLDDYTSTMQLNFFSAVQMLQKAAPGMKSRGFGRIIVISSAACLDPIPGQPDYGASKAALINLVVSTSKWLKNCGVTINAISPGAILTDALKGYLETTAQARQWQGDFPAIEAKAVKEMFRIPVGRVGRAEEIAGLVAFLSSDYGGFFHGANLHINGGVIGTVT